MGIPFLSDSDNPHPSIITVQSTMDTIVPKFFIGRELEPISSKHPATYPEKHTVKTQLKMLEVRMLTEANRRRANQMEKILKEMEAIRQANLSLDDTASGPAN